MSLRDQLLQAGLITKKQAQDAARKQRPEKGNKAPRGEAPKPTEAQLAAQKAQEQKIERDRELNRKAQEKSERKARQAQVRQLVIPAKLPKVDSDQTYNFADGKNIRRLPVTPELRKKLIEGKLGIVRCDGRYEMVPADIAEKVRERDAQALVFLATAEAPPAEDDPYKDFPIPDDLTW